MPKRKAAQSDNTESDSAKEKKEGGPLERQRSFMRQRAAVLRPREDSQPREEGKAAPPGDSHQQAMSEYRKRQKAAPRSSKKQS